MPGDEAEPLEWATQRGVEDRARAPRLPRRAIDGTKAVGVRVRQRAKRGSQRVVEGGGLKQLVGRQGVSPFA